MNPPRRIGLLLFPDMTALDLVGPMDAFATATSTANGPPCYETVVIGVSAGAHRAESGLQLSSHCTLDTAPPLDTLIVPGGRGLREPAITAAVAAWLLQQHSELRRIATVCTGIYGLAPTGLLDGRRVTTHWAFTDAVAQQFPKLRVETGTRFVQDGKFHTSGGVTSGIDMALAMIEADCGAAVALAAARELAVQLER